MNQPRISIIIPCLNEANYISELLEDLANQDVVEPFEVVVADSTSNDNTLKVAEQFADKLNLKTTNTERMSAGHTRNAGAEIAGGKYFLFLDADGRVKSDFLRILLEERDERDADMMTSKMKVTGWHPFDKVYTAFVNFYFQQSFNNEPRMSGALQFVSSELHRNVDGYIDKMTVGEDVNYSERIASLASQPHFVDQALIATSNRRFKTDGRFTMYLRAAQWSGAPAVQDNRASNFKFGHYNNLGTKIKIREIFLDSEIRRAFFAATRAFVVELTKIIRK